MVGTSNLGSWNGHWSSFRGVDQESIIKVLKGPVLRALSTGCLLLGGCNQQKTKWSCLKTQSAGKAPTIWMSCKNGRSMRIKQWLLVEEPWLFELSGLLLAKPYPVWSLNYCTCPKTSVGFPCFPIIFACTLLSVPFYFPCCYVKIVLVICRFRIFPNRLSKSPSKSWFQKKHHKQSKSIKDHQKPSRLMWMWVKTLYPWWTSK
jgi:hypothetical protein